MRDNQICPEWQNSGIRNQDQGSQAARGRAAEGEGRVADSHERCRFESPVAASAVAGIGYPAVTINVAGTGRQLALSIPVRHPITLPCSSLPFFQ